MRLILSINRILGGIVAEPTAAGTEAAAVAAAAGSAAPSEAAVTKQTFIQEKIDLASEKLHVQPWGVVAILIGVSIVILGVCFFCIRRCCRKRRGKDGKKGMKGVDLKSVQLLGSAYKEKVFIISSFTIIKNFFLDPFRYSLIWKSSPKMLKNRTKVKVNRVNKNWENCNTRFLLSC